MNANEAGRIALLNHERAFWQSRWFPAPLPELVNLHELARQVRKAYFG